MTQRRWQVLSLGSFGKWVSWENERDGEEGREMQACRMLFEEKQLGDGTGALLPTVWLPCERSSNKLADRTAQWADVAHIQLDGWMHNSRVVYINQISPGSWRTCSFMQHEFLKSGKGRRLFQSRVHSPHNSRFSLLCSWVRLCVV